MTKHPDTAAGAAAALDEIMSPRARRHFTGASWKPDPSVDGVWQATAKSGKRAIVYLAGYRDPVGRIRSHDDFETNLED